MHNRSFMMIMSLAMGVHSLGFPFFRLSDPPKNWSLKYLARAKCLQVECCKIDRLPHPPPRSEKAQTEFRPLGSFRTKDPDPRDARPVFGRAAHWKTETRGYRAW
ncbi:hypothetical protein FA13DRAFT_546770 [Coprinellus micaceus]|uniref:Secreted protein n=1 Tax=Coprinellus micaceus TaxID=71717 RepID=A0A4Y7T8T1_COPMI|nr:hypothetical protein FA13DRAFT_546770 [Coprinellus micaceus]